MYPFQDAESNIAYISLLSSTRYRQNVRSAFLKLKEKNPKGVILDLRDNLVAC